MLQVGIIGAGNFSIKHIHAMRKVENVQLKSICRTDPVALKKLRETYNVDGSTDYKVLLKDPSIEAVLIATPHHLHCQIALEAAASGKHILLEKPLASTWADCQKIYEGCKANSVKLLIAQVGQFTTAFAKAKAFLASGQLGDILMAKATSVSYWKHSERQNWHLRKESGGGYLLTLGVHQIDLLCALIPSNVISVYAKITNRFHKDEVEDGVIAVLNFENGTCATLFFAGFKSGVNQVETALVGSNGILKISFDKGVSIGKDGNWQSLEDTFQHDWMDRALEEEWRSFSSTIQQDIAPAITPEHALHVMEIIFAIKLSSESGREIPLPLEKNSLFST